MEEFAFGGNNNETIFQRIYYYDDGTIIKWNFDLNKRKNGPISTEILNSITEYDFKELKNNINYRMDDDKNLPLSQRKWLNPNNGKLVDYTRAKNLNLI